MSDNSAVPAEPAAPEVPAAPATPTPSAVPSSQPADPVRLPDDHPLVKTLAAQKATIADLKTKVSDQRTDADRIADLEKQVAGSQLDALRFKVASKHGISDTDIDTFLTGTDEDTLTRQAQRLAELSKASATPTGAYVPQSGHQPSAPALNSDELENALRRKLGIPT